MERSYKLRTHLYFYEEAFMPTNIKLQTAIHLALGLGAGAMALSFAPDVVAQDAQDDDALIEEVVVTGSRIRRADIDSASPVTILSRADIEAAGVTDVGELLQRLPSMSGSPIGTTTNNGGNGAVLIDLRGMGVNRTLTLINGQRVVDGGDYQTIPSTMIERVEILKDGASAVYGADAVAGVVNIITRRDFEGVEVTAQYADWMKTDAGRQWSIGLISGSEFETGNVVFGLEYVDQKSALQSDTPWAFMQDSPYIYPAGCEKDGRMFDEYKGGPDSGCYMGGSSRIPEGALRFVGQGRFLIEPTASEPYEVGLMIPHDGRNYNYAPVNFIQTPFKRTNIFSESHFDITDTIRFNSEFRANYRRSQQKLAPMPYDTRPGLDPAHAGVFDGVAYNGISEENYYLRRAVDLYNDVNDADLQYEPMGDVRRRMIEGDRTFDQQIVQIQYVMGFEGTFADMDWDVYLNQGWRSRTDVDKGQVGGAALNAALGPSADRIGDDGRPECYTSLGPDGALIDGCVPLNLFGGGSVIRETGEITSQSITPDMLNYISVPLTDVYKTRQTLAGANLTGSAWELPAGPLGWAVGYGYWKQNYTYDPDSAKASDTVSGNTGEGTKGSLTNNNVYLEVLAPVWDNGTQNLYLKGGVRYDDWDAFKGDTTWQIGVELQALEALKVRGTYGTVFRVPTISNLFGGVVDSFPTYNDPCVTEAGETLPPGCEREGVQDDNQVPTKVGGNPNVIPETGHTWTAGLVWAPTFGEHGFTATVDYWSIDLKDGISSYGVDFILNDCYVNQNPDSCALVTRRPDYSVGRIVDVTENVSEQGGKGVDTEIRWDYSSNIGQWQAAILWSHLIERTKVAFPGAPEEDLSGRYTDPTAQDQGAFPNDKINYSVQWFYNDFSVGYMGEYISSLDATAVFLPDYEYKVKSQLYHDLMASYNWRNTTFSAGLTNFTNKKPPYIDAGFNAKTDPPTYRMFGRGYYLKVAWKF
jgi:iron complex outermembrane receptor protein